MISAKIVGWGSYQPRTQVLSTQLDARLGLEFGTVEATYGIASRGVAARDETSSVMAAKAGAKALAMTGWKPGEFDVLIGACGVMEQPIPSTSILIQHELGLGASGIMAFDVNQTCLSFVAGLDIASLGLATGRWKRALIVSADIASAGLDENDAKILSIFGDGAAAIAIEATQATSDGSAILASKSESYGEGHKLATLRSGGTKLRIEDGYEALKDGARFQMDAFGIFKAAAKRLPNLIDSALKEAGLTRDQIDHVVCHQASAPGVEHVGRLFKPRSERVINIFPQTGNQIASSIPTVLSHGIETGIIKRGDRVMLLGTAAGISASAMILRF